MVLKRIRIQRSTLDEVSLRDVVGTIREKTREQQLKPVWPAMDALPSDLGTGTNAGLEEERQLLYVAITRAKDDLRLVVLQRLSAQGQHSKDPRRVNFFAWIA